MNRKAIRLYARALLDEYTEKPGGMFYDEDAAELDLNEMINVAQVNVYLDLIPHIPNFFRKPVLISIVANQRTYEIKSGGDINITDFFLFENIYHNESGRKPKGLLYVEPDQLCQFGIKVGDKGSPKVWSYEEEKTVAFDPTPDTSRANWYKGFYFFELPDLNHDDSDVSPNVATPLLPKSAHILISIDTARQGHMITKEGKTILDTRYEFYKGKATRGLSIKPSLSTRRKIKLSEQVRG